MVRLRPKVSESIAKTSHKYNNGTVTTQPTCDKNGVKTFACACGASYTETIAKTGHNYDGGKITKNATCNATGVKTYTCKNCNAKYDETIAKIAHAYEHHDATGHYEKVLVKAAWDEVIEETHNICNQCGKDFGKGPDAVDEAGFHVAGGDGTDCQNYSVKSIVVGTKHHDAVYENKWVVDSPAYDQCKNCGHKK